MDKNLFSHIDIPRRPSNEHVETGDDGTFVYVPNNNFVGADLLDYTVNDTYLNDTAAASQDAVATHADVSAIPPGVALIIGDGVAGLALAPGALQRCASLIEIG